jgi:PAS domain S-box-containing protein
MSLRAYLARLIWLCILPLLLLAAYLAVDIVRIIGDQRDRDATSIAKNYAVALDRHLNQIVSAMEILAVSPLADDPAQWQGLYREAQGFQQGFGGAVILSDQQRRMLFNTRAPFGTALPMLPQSKGHTAVPDMLATGQPAVGDLLLGPVANEPLIAVAVPIRRQGAINLLLLATFEPSHFQQQLDGVTLPADVSLSLLDSTGAVIARRAPADLESAKDVDASGRHVIQSKNAPWTVVLEIPRHSHQAPLIAAATVLAMVVLGATLISVLGGAVAGRRLGRSMASLAESPAPDVPLPNIREVSMVRRALAELAAEREKSESRLDDGERRFRRLFHEAPVAQWLVGCDGVLLGVNAHFVRLFGYGQADVLTIADWWLRACPDHAYRAWAVEAWNSGVARAAATGTDIEPIECRITCKSGEVRTVEISGIAIGSDFLTTFFDITERLRAEEEFHQSQAAALEEQRQAQLAALNLMEDAVEARLRTEAAHAALLESEDTYRSLFSNMLNGLAYCRMLFEDGKPCDFIYLSNNAAFEKLTGLKDVVGRRVTDVIPGIRESDPGLLEIYGRVVTTGEPAQFETFVHSLRMWFSISVYRPAPEHFVAVFDVITERKKAEADRFFFSEALRQSVQPLLLANAQHRITYINPAFTRLFGYELSDLAGEHVSRLSAPTDDARRIHAEVSRQAEEHGVWCGEMERLCQDGTKIPIIANIGALHDERGDLVGFVGSYLDLRPLREKDASLRKLAQAVEQSPGSVIITDVDANIEYVNEAFVQSTGYGREEAIGRNPRFLQSGKTAREGYDAMWAALSGDRLWKGEFTNRRKDGSEFIEFAIIAPIHQADGQISHFVAMKEDITERKRIARELDRYRLHLEDLVHERTEELQKAHDELADTQFAMDCVGIGIHWVDVATGRLLYVNQYAADLLGYTVEEMLTLSVPDIDPNFAAVPFAQAAESFTRERRVQFETTNLTKDSRAVPVEITLHYLPGGGNTPARFIVFVTDITQRKDAELTLLRAKEVLRQHNESLESIVAERTQQVRRQTDELERLTFATYHDLQEPVRGIVSYSQLIERRLGNAVDTELREYLGFLLEAARRMRDMVGGLQRFAQAGLRPTTWTLEDCNKLVAAAIDDLEESIAITGATVTVTLLPTLRGSQEQLRYLFYSLLSNALKFARADVPPTISIAAVADNDHWHITVADNGLGIEPQYRDQVFSPFTRVHAAQRYPGAGLGLAISRRIVEAHAGRIWIDSAEQAGTIVHFTLPRPS